MNEDRGVIVYELKELIKILKTFKGLQDVAAKIDKISKANRWEQPTALEFREYRLNGVCVGLGRYLDESGAEWRGKPKIRNQLNSLVISAAKILSQRTPTFHKQSCGCHEDGACVIESLGPRGVLTKQLEHLSGSLKLDPFEAACFTSIPIEVILPKGTKIQRIINSKQDVNNARWWKLDPHTPKSRQAWREDYAVLSMWNDNNWSVLYELKKDTPIWLGNAASQIVEWIDQDGIMISELCILKGGKAQILLDPTAFDIRELKQNLIKTHWPKT